MIKKGIIILGSSRSNGNTYKVTSFLKEKSGFDLIDLKSLNINGFDYDFNNQNDDFMPLMKNIVSNYKTIVFATPVYWYAMSGIMKIFFERITDCLKIEKDIGRKLRGKSLAVISCGSDEELMNGFNMPFEESARYLGMNYVGDIHTWIEEDRIPDKLKVKLSAFAEKLRKDF